MLSLNSKNLKLFLILIGLLSTILLCGIFLFKNFQGLAEREYWVQHAADVISELDLTLSSVKDAETGVRGYLLTKEESYLAPYQTGTTETLEHLNRLMALTEDNRLQQERALDLKRLVQERLEILEAVRIDFNAGLFRSRQQRDKLIKNPLVDGKVTMDMLRSQINKMKASEQQLLKERGENLEESRSAFLWVLGVTTGIPTLAILIAFIQIGQSQARSIQESLAKTKEARDKELISELAKTLAGDVSLGQAGENILKFLSQHLGAPAGKIWFLEHGNLTIKASYGLEESNDFKNGKKSHLVETAFDKKKIWQIDEVPRSYWKLASGLGESAPTTLTFAPFAFQGKDLGVVELGGFSPHSSEQLSLLQQMTETIAVGLNAAQSRTALQTLLEKTQQQSEELQAQQEELRTNNEELEQQARALESQQQALGIKNKELENIKDALEKKATDLHLSSQYKSEFLAKMSHELRTPLNGLLILSTLLTENKEKNLTEQQKQFAKSIHNAGNDLLTLINDILDLSKIEARKLSLRPEEFTLSELFSSNQHIFEPQTSSKGLGFECSAPADLAGLKLFTDRQRLEQILRNFLSNAIKFTEKGSISLAGAYNAEQKTLRLTVEDTGIGIAKHKQNIIFEAFEQADSSVSRRYGGTGLGLTISRELARLLGGKIYLESEEGKGSRFTVEIPIWLNEMAEPKEMMVEASPSDINRRFDELTREANANQKTRLTAKKALETLTPGKKTILVVEDDDGFRSLIVDAVKSYGFEAIEAADGEVTLALLNEHAPDAILLDIKLPGISGLGILEMIKQMPHLRHIPVHMISALEYQHNALRMGAFGYLTKPVTMEKIWSALGRIEDQISKKLRRVLLIEDDERQNKAISLLIGGNDLEVVSAKTGKKAVEELKRDRFDCIILDLTLPDVSGFDLLSELRALDVSLPPVVIYTGKDLSDEEERYLRKYSESIVIKGVRSPERLLDEVNLFLHRVESLLPESKRQMLSTLRSQENSFEGKTVLVVDDDIRNVFALTSALETKGLHVRIARDGAEALEMIEQHGDINIVLMDIMMPKMDGFEAIRKIRGSKDLRIQSLPLVALTAKAMKEDHEKCMEAGANDYLPKPVNVENLMTVLKVWLTPKGFLV